MTALLAIAILFLIGIPVASFLTWSGARVAGIEGASFKRSLLAAMISGAVIWSATLAFSVLPEIGTLLGFLSGTILTVFVIRLVYETSLSKAILTWIFYVFAQIVTIVIGVASGAGAIQSVMQT